MCFSTKVIDSLKLALIGLCMGVANVIPGVSGGTIAFLFGIYEPLIGALSSFDTALVKLIFQGRIREAYGRVRGPFLTALLSGVLVSILIFARLLSWLLSRHPVSVNAFFFGLVLATVPIIAGQLKQWTPKTIALGAVTVIFMYLLVGGIPIQTPDALWFVFLSGAVAISAMILPGISGAFILVLLGKYEYIINAVSDQNIPVLLAVALGSLVGILTFVRLLRWLFQKYHDGTVVVLTGLVLGSLRKIWPWKETVRQMISPRGKVIPVEQINILPQQLDAQVALAIVLCVAGFVLALLLSRINTKGTKGIAV